MEQIEQVRKIIAQGMAAKIPAHITANRVTDTIATFSRGTVWVVTIQLAETIIAVGSDLPTALHWAGVKAAEFLTLRECVDDNGYPWLPDNLLEYFGYAATELEIDGAGDYH